MLKKIDLYSKYTDLKIAEIKKCKFCNKEFAVFDIEKEIYDKHWFKLAEHCSDCNFKLLNSFINDKHLYHRKDIDWNNIISVLSDSYSWEVIEVSKYKNLVSDDFALKFWKNLCEDIFAEFYDLYNSFPKASRLVYPWLENADYSSHVWWSKNLYLSYCVFWECEDVYYSSRVVGDCKNIFSSYNLSSSSNTYFSSNLWSSNNIFYSDTIVDSSDLLYCRDMNNCKHCIFSCNSFNKSYLIFNKQYEKQEYFKIKEEILKKLNNKKEAKDLIEKYNNFIKDNLIKESLDTNRCENVFWENLYFSSNVANSFISIWIKNSANIMTAWDTEDDYMNNIFNSIEIWTNVENIIWSCSILNNVYNVFFSFWVVNNSKNIYYSIDMDNCEECMFCVALKWKKYHILNIWYSKDEYFFIKDKLIGKFKLDWKWWKSLWFDLFPFPYNDTLAYDYFKVNKIIYPDWKEEIIDKSANGIVSLESGDFISDAVLDLWWEKKINIKWRTKNKEINIPENSITLDSSELPSIEKVDESILDKVIICSETKRPYRIISQELDFLKKHKLALPEFHNELRNDKLMWLRPIWQIYTWVCNNCNDEILTVFKSKAYYKVYCPICYKKFMYW